MGRSPGRRSSTRTRSRSSSSILLPLALLLVFCLAVESFSVPLTMWSQGRGPAAALLRARLPPRGVPGGRLLLDGTRRAQAFSSSTSIMSMAAAASSEAGGRGRLEYDVIVVGGCVIDQISWLC